MKRFFQLVALLAIALVAMPQAASAQRGEKALGVAGGYASHNEGGYMNLYFHYGLANHVRLAPEIGYVFRNEGVSAFEMSVDVEFPFRIARAFNVYPLVGVTFNNWSPRHGDSLSRFGGDFGVGFDIYLTSQLKLNPQFKYSLMNDTSGVFLGMGIAYVF